MKKQIVILIVASIAIAPVPLTAADKGNDPPEVAIGERLFVETRFAQAWYTGAGKPDPVMDKTATTNASLPGPFAGKTMNCRSCHLVDEHASTKNAGMRTYSDFARRSPIPLRDDGNTLTGRNSMVMVGIAAGGQDSELFHHDGQFNSIEDLVKATLTGRNLGWKPKEYEQAIKHVASVIRNDRGDDELGLETGGSYRKLFKSDAANTEISRRLPEKYRLDIDQSSDEEIVDAVARLIGAYVRDLSFSQSNRGQYDGSSYDLFLELNDLPGAPNEGETAAAYRLRLVKQLGNLKQPKYVTAEMGSFKTHNQEFKFSALELRGMKLFLTEGDSSKIGGNCGSCHVPPHFSDFGFHNTGLTQTNYDKLHGEGEFYKLQIPSLKSRSANYDKYLPATIRHPMASSMFRTPAAKDKVGTVDLGLWNVFANPDMPEPQAKLRKILCDQANKSDKRDCGEDALLSNAIAAFKTPILRDLGHSAPYMHTGQHDSLNEAVSIYITSGILARAGLLRNADPELNKINLTREHVGPLAAFLNSLNEDYE